MLVLSFSMQLLPLVASAGVSQFISASFLGLLQAVAGLAITGVTLPFVTVVLKWLLLGAQRPGRYPMYSWFFLRWWVMRRVFIFTNYVVLHWVRETPFLSVYFRLLGCKIGRGVSLDTLEMFDFDMLVIDDDAVIEHDAMLMGHRFVDGHLVMEHVRVGPGCTVGPRSILMPGSSMGAGSELGAVSLLQESDCVPPQSVWKGTPAIPTDGTPRQPPNLRTTLHRRRLLFHTGQVLGLGAFVIVLSLTAYPSVVLFRSVPSQTTGHLSLLVLSLIFVLTTTVLGFTFIIVEVFLYRLLFPWGTEEGVKHHMHSWFALRAWFMDRLFTSLFHKVSCGAVLGTSSLFKVYLQLLGATVGSRVWAGVPQIRVGVDHLHIHDQVVMGGLGELFFRISRGGSFELRGIRLGVGCVCGNSVTILPGTKLTDDTTFGNLTLCDAETEYPPGSTWMGSPAAMTEAGDSLVDAGQSHEERSQARRRKQIAHADELQRMRRGTWGSEDEAEREPASTAAPVEASKTRYACYRAVELLVMFGLPVFFGVLVFVMLEIVSVLYQTGGLSVVAVTSPLLLLCFCTLVTFQLAILKRIFHGTSRGHVAFWTFRFMTWVVISQWWLILSKTIIAPFLQGTSILTVALRLLGAKVGNNVFIDCNLPVEVDAVSIGDDVVMQHKAQLIPHVVDNHRLQFAEIKIGSRCSLGANSVLMPMSGMGDDCSLGPLSVTMKGEVLPESSAWAGNPVICTAMSPKVLSRAMSFAGSPPLSPIAASSARSPPAITSERRSPVPPLNIPRKPRAAAAQLSLDLD